MKALFDPIGRLRGALFAAVAIALALVPVFVTNLYYLHVATLALVFAVFASSWNLVLGFAGLKALGHQAFFAIGAYASALTAMHLGVSPWLTIWWAGLVAALFGLIVGMPVLRLRSLPHVAIVTIAAAEIVRLVLLNLTEITRGAMGLSGIPAFEGFTLPLVGEVVFSPADKTAYYCLMLVLFFMAQGLIYWVVHSKAGLALVATRDSEDAAESLGINLTFYKLLAFVVSAFIIGVTGGFYAHFVGVLTPSSTAGIDLLIMVIAMILVGGLGTFAGPIIGAIVLIVGLEYLRVVDEFRMLIYGGLIVIIMILLPRGLATLGQVNWSARPWRVRESKATKSGAAPRPPTQKRTSR